MSIIIPIVNGDHNLCRIPKCINRAKRKGSNQTPDVLQYMTAVEQVTLMDYVIANILKAPADSEVTDLIKNFARKLMKLIYPLSSDPDLDQKVDRLKQLSELAMLNSNISNTTADDGSLIHVYELP